MTTEHRSPPATPVALSEARIRRKAWISAEIDHGRLDAQHQLGVAVPAADVERQLAR